MDQPNVIGASFRVLLVELHCFADLPSICYIHRPPYHTDKGGQELLACRYVFDNKNTRQVSVRALPVGTVFIYLKPGRIYNTSDGFHLIDYGVSETAIMRKEGLQLWSTPE